MGAAGKDFHIFNTIYRDRPEYRVVAFTHTQIPELGNRIYPPRLAGKLYPEGIPIEPEEDIVGLIRENEVDEVIFSYSDVSYDYIAERERIVQQAGAILRLAEVERMMIPSLKHCIAITAVRTGAGKSTVTRRVVQILRDKGRRLAVIRHPMPYGDLAAQEFQVFRTFDDLDRYHCTIEEREEYEPHIKMGTTVFAGVEYGRILQEAEKEADVMIWDGGNNDVPFYRPDVWICVADPLRAGHELDYYPGKINFTKADAIVINKCDVANEADIETVLGNAAKLNADAMIIRANSPITVDKPDQIEGRRVLVVEDGPTVTHGEMKSAAGMLAAKKFGAKMIVDPRPYATGTIADIFEKYPEVGPLLPSMGYSDRQRKDLEKTIELCECDTVIVATPIDLSRIVTTKKNMVRVTFELDDSKKPNLQALLRDF
ncbi:MAG: GTPase [Planctomycetes bacterium]|nr:GTPase [Planctomycetota bacterium]